MVTRFVMINVINYKKYVIFRSFILQICLQAKSIDKQKTRIEIEFFMLPLTNICLAEC